MERMGDILAKSARRHTRLRDAQSTRTANAARTIKTNGTQSTSAEPAQPVNQAMDTQKRHSAITRPLARRTSEAQARAATPASASQVTPRGSMRRTATPLPTSTPALPDVQPASPSSAVLPPTDVLASDRILEMPKRTGSGGRGQPRQAEADTTLTFQAYTAPRVPEPQPQASAERPLRQRATVVTRRATQPVAVERPPQVLAPAMSRRSAAMTSLGDIAQTLVAQQSGASRRTAMKRTPSLAQEIPEQQRSMQSKGKSAKSSRGSAADSAASVCPICGGAGFVRLDVSVGDPSFGQAVLCQCKEREIEERRRSELRQISSLDPFFNKTFETFETFSGRNASLAEACKEAQRFAEEPQGWLVLMGGTGVGKTHLAAAIANAVQAKGETVFFSIVPDLLDHLRAAFAPTSETTYDALFDKIREAYLLVLDDLGAENSTAWATEKLFQIINYRYNHHMPTVITTNHKRLAQLDERIRSRLTDVSFVIPLSIEAQDYRGLARNAARGGANNRSGAARGRGYTR